MEDQPWPAGHPRPGVTASPGLACSSRASGQAGAIDVVVNNAGVVSGARLLEIPDEAIERTMAVNVLAPCRGRSGRADPSAAGEGRQHVHE